MSKHCSEGRIKIRLRKLLLAEGFIVDHFWEQHGNHRIHKYEHDLACWGASASYKNVPVAIASWDTMSDCVKFGVSAFRDRGGSWEVSSLREDAAYDNMQKALEDFTS